MADQKIKWTILDPQLVVAIANTPLQISSTRLVARTVLISNDRDNTGRIIIADSAAKVIAGNGVKIDPNEAWELHQDNYDNVSQFVNLTEWYWAGDTIGDKLVVEILWEEE